MKKPARKKPAAGSGASARRAKERGSSPENEPQDGEQVVSAPSVPPVLLVLPEEGAEPPRPPRAPGSGACHPYVRRQVAKALPELCVALAEVAKKGDVAAIKLLWHMAELDKKREAVPERADVTKFVRETLAAHRQR